MDDEQKLFSEEYMESFIDWGELIHCEDGSSYIDKRLKNDYLNFQLWYMQFKSKKLLDMAKLAAYRVVDTIYFPASDLDDREYIKKNIIKGIIFEILLIKKTGEFDCIDHLN